MTLIMIHLPVLNLYYRGMTSSIVSCLLMEIFIKANLINRASLTRNVININANDMAVMSVFSSQNSSNEMRETYSSL